MRLARAVIKRFKSIREVEIRIPERAPQRQGSADFVSILGENNAGKSSIIEAIRLACPGGPKPTKDQFPGLEPAQGPIEIDLEFNHITPKDKENSAIGGHIFTRGGEEIYHLKKTWKSPNGQPECSAYNPNRGATYQFKDWPGDKSKKELASLGPDWENLVAAADKKKKSPKHSKETYLEVAQEIQSPLIELSVPDPWFSYPTSALSSIDAALPIVIYVPALRETSEVADVSEKQSAIRRIVNALFEQQLSAHDKVIRFRQAAVDLEQLFATEGKHSIVAKVESQITSKLKELIDIGADLRFNVPDVTSDLASRTELRIMADNVSTLPEHQGHGAQRSIVLALIQMYAEQLRESEGADHQPMLFLIEEPEIYMHPEMCRRMRDALLRIAQNGIGQVICTTHSPVFLDLADRHDGIVIVKKTRGTAAVTQRVVDVFDESESGKQSRARLRMLLNFDPSANEVFFTERVCLVEGDCEVAALDAIARKLHSTGRLSWQRYLDARRSVTIINCRGKWTIVAFQEVLRAFGIDYCVVHDEDDGKSAAANDRIGSLLPSVNARLLHSPNFERAIFNESWQRDKPWKATTSINESQDINAGLLRFFEFVLGKSVAQLAEPTAQAGAAGPTPRAPAKLSRKNFRNRLKKIKAPTQQMQAAQRLAQVLRLAAGPGIVPDQHLENHLPQTDGLAAHKLATVFGESMADTLLSGDVVALKVVDYTLQPVPDEAPGLSHAEVSSLIEHDGLYALATNEDIDERKYTIKRVRIKPLKNDKWDLEIIADNPETSWGERGIMLVRKQDRVHFAAQVVGIVESDEEPGTASEELQSGGVHSASQAALPGNPSAAPSRAPYPPS